MEHLVLGITKQLDLHDSILVSTSDIDVHWSDDDYEMIKLTIEGSERALLRLSNILSIVILDELRNFWMTTLIKINYGFLEPYEQDRIVSHTMDIVEQKLTPANYQSTASSLHSFLQESSNLILEGFVRFRMKWFWNLMQGDVEQAVDTYLLEKEYNEFIRLLRYFVVLQEPRTVIVHVLSGKNHGIRIIDEQGRYVEQDYVEREPFDFEDVIISAVISMAPRQIMVHLKSEHRISNVLYEIFRERVSFCLGCPRCNNMNPEARGSTGKNALD